MILDDVRTSAPRQREESGEGRWYTYDFPAKPGVRCGLAGCTQRHLVVYVGKTSEPWERVLAHHRRAGWIGLTSGYRIHDETYATEREALAAEARMIRQCRPLANDRHNRGNPHRLVFPKAPGSARRRPHARRPVSRPLPDPPRRRRWSRRQRRVAVLSALWLVLAVAGWWASVHWAGLAVAGGAKAGVFGAAAVFVVAWVNRRPRRRRR